MKTLIPINAYPVLFWYDLEFMTKKKKIEQMKIELNTNLIYLN